MKTIVATSGVPGSFSEEAAHKFMRIDRPGSVEQRDLKNEWVEHALSFVEPTSWPSYSVAIDAGNGMAGLIMPQVQSHTPLIVTELFYDLDGTFPNHPPDPVNPENLRVITTTVQQNKLDFGIAFDGDGDRAFLIDGQGRVLSGTILTAIIAADVLQRHPGATILYNAVIGNIVPETVEKLGGQAIRTRVGHTFIEPTMWEHQAEFAGEGSGHLYFHDNYFAGSGLIGALVAIDILARSGKSLAELHNQYAVYAQSGEINFTVPDVVITMNRIASHYTDGAQDRLDGLTVRYADWWFNVRPSNTEPLLRLNVEAHTPEILEKKTQELRTVIDGQ